MNDGPVSLRSQVEQAFADGGLLASATGHFVPRPAQTIMALAVVEAIESAQALVVEASTGTGKTFAYLVPALLSGERVLLSTATKALQDQLFAHDLPEVLRALNLPVRAALLKGRSSYVCLHRMELARHEPLFAEDTAMLASIERWSLHTTHGDLAELDGLNERSPLVALVTSTRDSCLGSGCPRVRECHVNRARKEAMAAAVVVVNHHLFFADLAVRESEMAELLPSVRVVIFDEAHQLNEIGVQFLGSSVTTGQLLALSHAVLSTGHQLARGYADWPALAQEIEQASRELRMCAGQHDLGGRLPWTAAAPDGVLADWLPALQNLHAACARAAEVLQGLTAMAPDLTPLRERACLLTKQILAFLGPCEAAHVRWLEVGTQLRLLESPLNISSALKTRMLENPERAGTSWVFTSATLGDDDTLSWFTEPCGLVDAAVLRLDSPFDYVRQAALYVPADFPLPGDSAHMRQVAESAARWARQLGGRTMILTTTLKALRTIAQVLGQILQADNALELLVQGEQPKRALIERFKAGRANGGKGCVLVGSASFWEGIDIVGDALQLLIIDKLPFPPPDDPVAQARSEVLQSQGRSPFKDYFLSEAALALKQGAGRLIRRETDQGVLVICDPRLISKGYGKRLLRALPPMPRLTCEEELLTRLADLTKTCTTACLPI